MRQLLCFAATAALALGASSAFAQTATFDFEDGTDQGFGLKFSNDASASFPNVSIGGSKRMEVLKTTAFQEADRGSAGDAGFLALSAAANNPSGYNISYDWYVDTSLSPGAYGNFLQLGTYFNAGSGEYTQDFPTVKDVELDGSQLASGQIFSGTVTETVAAKYGALAAGFTTTTFLRFGFIMNGDGTNAKVYFDNIKIAPAPEPASIAAGLAMTGLFVRRRRIAK